MELSPWQVRRENGTLWLHLQLFSAGMVPSSSGDQRRGPAFTRRVRPTRRRDPLRPDPTGPLRAALEASSAEAGGARPRWSITLASPRQLRPRWLAENGHFTSDPSRALRMVNPEVAVRRLHDYLELRGWPTEALERFRLVPAPGYPQGNPLTSADSMRQGSSRAA